VGVRTTRRTVARRAGGPGARCAPGVHRACRLHRVRSRPPHRSTTMRAWWGSSTGSSPG
jgi:hypothetical protein